MCGKYAADHLTQRQMLKILEGYLYHTKGPQPPDPEPEINTSDNIRPTNEVAIVRQEHGAATMSAARWWFVPHWHKGDVKAWKATTFNARIETASSKPTFRAAWKSHRCILPATAYYEWTGPKGKRTPNRISVKQNTPLIYFAGLYSTLQSGQSTCTILTRAASPDIEHIHHRMPVILSAEEVSRWLGHKDADNTVIEEYGTSYAGRFEVSDQGPEQVVA